MENMNKPIFQAVFKDLAFAGSYRVKCPFCKRGVLALRRCEDTQILQETACCTVCCQHVKVLDIDDLRADDLPSTMKGNKT